jgi:hypothetical protein
MLGFKNLYASPRTRLPFGDTLVNCKIYNLLKAQFYFKSSIFFLLKRSFTKNICHILRLLLKIVIAIAYFTVLSFYNGLPLASLS